MQPEQPIAAPKRVTVVAGVAAECPFEKGSNREAWYLYAQSMVGKTADEFVADATAKAKAGQAVTYHKRGKRAGQAEDPVEWLLWMASKGGSHAVKLAHKVA